MNRILFLTLSGALLSAICVAQSESPAGNPSAQSSATGAAQSATQSTKTAGSQAATAGGNASQSPVQPGSIIYAELAKSVDAKKAKAGDEVQAKATQAVLSQGKIVIPKGSKIVGHVAQASPKGDQPSQLVIGFDRAILKDGTQVPLSVSLQAVGGGAHASAVGPDQSPSGMSADRGISSSGMPGRPSGEASGGYGAPGGNMGGGMGSTSAGAGADTGGVTAAETGPSTVHLNAGSRGVVGLAGLSLSEGAQGAVITSDKKNVKLDSGIELVLREK
jgi:hypothetical protein